MALDYKTLQAVVAEHSPLQDQYCPECGQSLRHLIAMSIDKPSSGPFWWVLLAAGILMLIASGVRALSDYQWVARPELLPHLTGLIGAQDESAVNQLLPNNAIERVDRDLLVGAVGLLLALVSLSSVARHRLTRLRSARFAVSRVLLGVWGSAETLFVSLFGIALLLFSYLLVSALIAGETLTLALTDDTARRTVDMILFTVDLIAAGYPRV